MLMHQELGEFMLTRDREQSEPEKIINVNDVLRISSASPWRWWASRRR